MPFIKRTSRKRTPRAMPAASSSGRADVVTMSLPGTSRYTPPEDESRATAIDPNVLTVEIGLLLDYISGFPGRSLTSGSGRRPPYSRPRANPSTILSISRSAWIWERSNAPRLPAFSLARRFLSSR